MDEGVAAGIDIGTTAIKAALIRPDGMVLAGVRTVRRGGGLVAWERAAAAAIAEMTQQHPEIRVETIGVSGRGGSPVLVDAGGRQLVPAGLTNAVVADPRVAALTGDDTRLQPLASHVLRTLQQQPSLRPRLRVVLSAKDALVYRLTGAATTDPASGPDRRTWPERALRETGFPLEALPQVRLPWEPAGPLGAAAARRLGLPSGLPVAAGAHDGVAAQIGTGMVHAGDAALTMGTHAVLRVVADQRHEPARQFLFYSLWGEQDRRTVYGGNARLGGLAAAWLARLFGAGERSLTSLEAAATALPARCHRPLFLPFLGGMYYPERHPAARGAFIGLTPEHRGAHLYLAVLEGVAFALRHIEESLRERGLAAQRAVLTGAGSRSLLWRSLLAASLETPLAAGSAPEYAECVGAARCAWVAAGRFSTLEQALEQASGEATLVQPGEWPGLEERYQAYRQAADQVINLLPTSTP
jgi:xylulokinase